MAGSIVKFSGFTNKNIDPDQVLQESVGNLKSVIVIGQDKFGDLYLASSSADIGGVNLQIDMAKNQIINSLEVGND